VILTEGQIRAQVRTIRKKSNPTIGVFALRTDQPWSGPAGITIDGQTHRVAYCRSELEMRELLLASAAENVPLVALCPFASDALGEDVLARLAKRRVHPPNAKEILGNLFQATSVDSRIFARQSLPDALIENAPGDGYPPVPSGVLDLQSAWQELMQRLVGNRDVATNIGQLLEASLDSVACSRFAKMSPDLRRDFFEWAAGGVDPAAGWMAHVVMANRTADLVPLGLLLEVVFDAGLNSHAGVAGARVRLESWFAGHSIALGAARSWAAAARAVVMALHKQQGSGPLLSALLSRLDALLFEFKIPEVGVRSDFSPQGFELRMRGFAGALAQLSKPATTLRRVVLPEPLGPSRAKNSPCSTRSSTPSTARTDPKDLWMDWRVSAGRCALPPPSDSDNMIGRACRPYILPPPHESHDASTSDQMRSHFSGEEG